jgi:predicted nucleotidyltransferase
MNRDEVIAKLRQHEPELKAVGVVRLSLFGSTARAIATRIPIRKTQAARAEKH